MKLNVSRLRRVEKKLATLGAKLDSRATCGSFEVNINSDLETLRGKCGVLTIDAKDDDEWTLIVSRLPPDTAFLITPKQLTPDEWMAQHGTV